MNPTVQVAIVSALGGGTVATFVKKFLNRRSDAFREGAALRKELRDDLDRLQSEVNDLRGENSEWQSKYWDLVKVNASQNIEIENLKNEIVGLNDRINELTTEIRKFTSQEVE